MKLEERQQARFLREVGGYSIGHIAAVVGVSKSTVSLWTRDIELTPAQQCALHPSVATLRGTERRRRNAAAQREAYQAAGRRLARQGDPLHVAGCMLYWGEGAKSRNAVVLVNSDAGMLRFFLRFLAECYGVTPDQVSLRVNCFLGNGLTLDEVEAWWLEQLGLPASCLRKAAVNKASRASMRKRRQLVYGTARVAVHSTAIVQSIYGAIQEYAAIERPEWLG